MVLFLSAMDFLVGSFVHIDWGKFTGINIASVKWVICLQFGLLLSAIIYLSAHLYILTRVSF